MERIKKDDTVIVKSGESRGKKGQVIRVDKANQKVYIKGLNLRRKSIKKSQEMPSGGFIEVEGPIHLSNVMPLCPKNNKGVRIGFIVDKDDVKKRQAKGVNYVFD